MEWSVDKEANYLDEDYILNILNDYLINTFDLYDGKVIEGLSYTMYNVEILYGIRKDYTVVLFVVLDLLESYLINFLGIKQGKYSSFSEEESRDLEFWKQKLIILIKENGIDDSKLEIIVTTTIEKNLSQIFKYIIEKGIDGYNMPLT